MARQISRDDEITDLIRVAVENEHVRTHVIEQNVGTERQTFGGRQFLAVDVTLDEYFVVCARIYDDRLIRTPHGARHRERVRRAQVPIDLYLIHRIGGGLDEKHVGDVHRVRWIGVCDTELLRDEEFFGPRSLLHVQDEFVRGERVVHKQIRTELEVMGRVQDIDSDV